MAQGKVSVNNLNLGQGELPGVEKKLLFIGTCYLTEGHEVGDDGGGDGDGDGDELEFPFYGITSVNTQTNFDELLGDGYSELKTHLNAAQLNGGSEWEAKVYIFDDYINILALADTIATANIEGVVFTDSVSISKIHIEKLQALATTLKNTYAQPIFIIQSIERINTRVQTWPEYESELQQATNDLACDRVVGVPNLHGCNTGALAGRLCRGDVSIADKPMRVKTGPVLGLDPGNVDMYRQELSSATLRNLDALRFSVPQKYTGYPGIYWGDANTFDAPGNDYTVLEHVRITDKAARRIRIRAISMIADRSINSTPSSMAYTSNIFLNILKTMSNTAVVNGKTYPGDIAPPAADAITLIWESKSALKVFFKLTPYDSPVTIESNIYLDLSAPE